MYQVIGTEDKQKRHLGSGGSNDTQIRGSSGDVGTSGAWCRK